jgi:hypothetical protein
VHRPRASPAPVAPGDRTMLPRIDDSRWPIVRNSPTATSSRSRRSQSSRSLQRIFETKGALAMVVDIGAVKATALTALHRKRLAEESDRLAAMGAFLAEAVIVPNPILRASSLATRGRASRRAITCPVRSMTFAAAFSVGASRSNSRVHERRPCAGEPGAHVPAKSLYAVSTPAFDRAVPPAISAQV